MLIIFIFIFSFFLESFGQDVSQYPFVLHQISHRGGVKKIHLIDFNYDQKDELVMLVDQEGVKSSIRLYDYDLPTIYYQKNFEKEIIDFSSFNWDGKGFLELLLIEKEKHWINLLLLDIQLEKNDTLAFIPLISLDKYGENVSVRNPLPIDINNNGFKEIILAINSGFNPKIRAVWAVDLRNKKVLWEFPLAPNIRTLDIKHVNNTPYLLVSTQSPDNGYKIKDMSDSLSYALVLNPRTGKCIFKKEVGLGSSYTDVNFFNYKPDSEFELVTVTANQNMQTDDQGKIILWDFKSSSIRKQLDIFYTQEAIHIADVNNDGKNELLWNGFNDKILIYDLNLVPVDTISIPKQRIRLEKLIDINRDGFLEYIISADRTSTIVLNNKKEIQAKVNFYGEIFPISTGKKSDYVLGILNYDQKLLKVFSLQPNIAKTSNITINLYWGIFIGVTLIPLVILIFYFFYKRKLKVLSGAGILENLPFAVLITDPNEKIILCNREMEKILDINKNRAINQNIFVFFQDNNISVNLKKKIEKQKWRDQNFDIEKQNGDKKNLDGRIQQLWHRNTFLGYLLSVSDRTQALHYQQTIAWAAMAQRLAHEIKNPLTTVKLSLQRLKMEYEETPESVKNKYDKYVDSSLEEIIRLRKVSENFMKLCRLDLPKFQNVNLDEIIQKVITKFKLVVTENVMIAYNAEKHLPEIEADPDQIEAIISNVVDNAVKALSEKGSIEIRTGIIDQIKINQNIQFIQIEIEDNGKGIPEDQMDKIFEPYVKGDISGTGLGLAIVKKFVENHNGSIDIISKENTGTSVTIQIPIKQKIKSHE